MAAFHVKRKILIPYTLRYNTATIMKGANIMTTYHALQRTHERTGLNLKSSQRFIKNAIERGRQSADFSSKEREFLQRRETSDGHRIIEYNSFCFIVDGNGDTCITMFKLPEWFGKRVYAHKQQVRNARKYVRYCDYYGKDDIDDDIEDWYLQAV